MNHFCVKIRRCCVESFNRIKFYGIFMSFYVKVTDHRLYRLRIHFFWQNFYYHQYTNFCYTIFFFFVFSVSIWNWGICRFLVWKSICVDLIQTVILSRWKIWKFSSIVEALFACGNKFTKKSIMTYFIKFNPSKIDNLFLDDNISEHNTLSAFRRK